MKVKKMCGILNSYSETLHLNEAHAAANKIASLSNAMDRFASVELDLLLEMLASKASEGEYDEQFKD